MVALAITTFVILVINQLFNEVIQTVGRGTQAGEILQRSRAFDEQIAGETELLISGGRQPSTQPHDWFSRMVGPNGRMPGEPGGFLVIVQRRVSAPLTIEDALQVPINRRQVRSDQLMFIYDQKPLLDDTGKKRLPPLAPAGNGTYGGDMRNSINADYVRLWYGHAVQLPEDPSTFIINNHDLGIVNSTNPNAIAQDWVLGRHALFLTGENPVVLGGPDFPPFGNHAFNVGAISNVNDGGRLWHGMTDISLYTLDDILNNPAGPRLGVMPTSAAYQGQALPIAFTQVPLLTSAKPAATLLETQDVAPAHTYFMGGVSDFIVEWAGDLVTGEHYVSTNAQINAGPDGELDRDPEGRIKWYTNAAYSNPDPDGILDASNVNSPVTYPIPLPALYTPNMPAALVNTFARADVAYVWQHANTPQFTRWPWLIRIRYRLHDRRGEFNGREIIVNTATGETIPEPGAWFEMIIPVNHQGEK